jgi:hypothetical protein
MSDRTFSIVPAVGAAIELSTDAEGDFALMVGVWGIGVPPVAPRFSEGAGDGALYRGGRYAMRTIDLPVFIRGTERADIEAKVRRLARAVDPANGLPKLVATYANGEVFELPFVYTSGLEGEGTESRNNRTQYVLSITCPDPFWTARDAKQFSLIANATAVGLLPDLARLQIASADTLGDFAIDNPGDVPSPLTWVITGPGGPASVTVDGKTWTYTGVLTATDTVKIERKPGGITITDKNGANKYSSMAAAPKFAELPPGPSNVAVTFTNASPGSYLPTGAAATTNLYTNPGMESAGSVVTVSTNLSTNPRATADAGFLNNIAANHDRLHVTSGFPVHPRGITSAVRSNIKSGVAGPAALSMYNVDNLSNTAVQRGFGVWVCSMSPGFQVTSAYGFTPTPLTAGVWRFVTHPGLVAENTFARIDVSRIDGAAAVPGNVVYITGAIVVEDTVVTEYYDGSVPATADFTYSWTGAVGTSTSVKQATTVARMSQLGAVCIQSKEWAASGTSSLRVMGLASGATPSAAVVVGSTGTSNLISDNTVVPGKSYTALATVRLAAPQTGIERTYSRSLFAYDATNLVTVQSAPAPNTAGQSEVRVTFNVPSSCTNFQLRLYNGALVGQGDVWFDNLMIVEVPSVSEPYTGPFFDGATPTRPGAIIAWAGAANLSRSTSTPTALVGRSSIAGYFKPRRKVVY